MSKNAIIKLENEMADICSQMENSEELEVLLEKYQEVSDKFDSIDGHDYESNINKKLNLANLSKHKDNRHVKL